MKRVERIPKNLLPYLETDPTLYSSAAIHAFKRATGAGDFSELRGLSGIDAIRAKDLLDSHSVASKEPSPLLEGLWADGLEDYPLGVLIHDILSTSDYPRQAPLVERAWRFYKKVQDPQIKAIQSTLWTELLTKWGLSGTST